MFLILKRKSRFSCNILFIQNPLTRFFRVDLFDSEKKVNFVSYNFDGTPIIALQPGNNGNVLAVGSEHGLIRIFDTRGSFKGKISITRFFDDKM